VDFSWRDTTLSEELGEYPWKRMDTTWRMPQLYVAGIRMIVAPNICFAEAITWGESENLAFCESSLYASTVFLINISAFILESDQGALSETQHDAFGLSPPFAGKLENGCQSEQSLSEVSEGQSCPSCRETVTHGGSSFEWCNQ
jgi:hypothetical protein